MEAEPLWLGLQILRSTCCLRVASKSSQVPVALVGGAAFLQKIGSHSQASALA
jgi:hypothetical protein